MGSYAYRPVTVEHPAKMVDATTWKAVSAGQTGAEVVRDGDFVRVPLVLMDATAIKAYESGKRELSMGYSGNVIFGDGITPDGEEYDAVMTDLRMNHLALVQKARGGEQLRIGDRRAPGDMDRADNPNRKTTMSDITTRTVMVDGLPVECTDAAAHAIAKLQKQITDSDTAHATALAVRDADIAKKDAAIDDLKGKVLTDAAIDSRVQARADLIARAKSINDADYAGKTDADIRKSAVIAKLGDAAIAGKPDAYIDARFDILLEDSKKDPVTGVLSSQPRVQTINDNGYAESVRALNGGPNYKPNTNDGGAK
jgi:hypothetical protein